VGVVPRFLVRTKARKMEMLTLEELGEMRKIDIRTVDKNTLVDMSEYECDISLPQAERVRRIFAEIKNPYLFRLENMAIKLEFADNGKVHQDVMLSFLKRQKCGL